jgi:hypothetical protein
VPPQSWGWGRGHDAYFHDFESHERGDHYRPGGLSDLSSPVCLLVLEHDMSVGLQADSLAFYVFNFKEGLLGDIDSVLKDV